jgi:dolichol-phosphate mannosyltransferase
MEKISLIIAAKNEEKTIASVINNSWQFVEEIIVIDGHSEDSTREIAKKLEAKVFLDGGKGKGEALRIGIDKANEEIIVFIDADGSHECEDIPKIVGPIRAGQADLVIGSRGLGGSDELHGDLYKMIRLVGSSIITLVINWRFKVELTDSQNGFRAIKTEVARELNLKEDIFTIEQEMLIKTLKKGYVVSEVASHEYARKAGKSRINVRTMGWRYIWSLLKNIF